MSGYVDIGEDHAIEVGTYLGESAGVHIRHKRKDGSTCLEFIPLADRAWAKQFADGLKDHSWTVVSEAPLTLTPSIRCRTCGDHGFITDGRWTPA